MVKEPTLTKPGRSRLAQSRIDYIVYGNPKQVSRLVYDYGYVPPKSLVDLSKAVHELIHEKGKQVVRDLVKLHPDRDAILGSINDEEKKVNARASTASQRNKDAVPEKVAPANQDNLKEKRSVKECAACGSNYLYDSYCGCHHAYNDANENLSTISIAELRKRFIRLTEQSEAEPLNKKIADEATRVWNEIRLRNQSQQEAPVVLSISPREGLLILLLTIIAGAIIGYSLIKTKRYAQP